jgi:hypothetical protein
MKHIIIRAVIWFAVASAGIGCASTTPTGDGDAKSVQEQRCERLLRELRLYCKDGLADRAGSRSKDCMSRQLEVGKVCYW